MTMGKPQINDNPNSVMLVAVDHSCTRASSFLNCLKSGVTHHPAPIKGKRLEIPEGSLNSLIMVVVGKHVTFLLIEIPTELLYIYIYGHPPLHDLPLSFKKSLGTISRQ